MRPACLRALLALRLHLLGVLSPALKLALAGLLASFIAVAPAQARGDDAATRAAPIASIALDELPREAIETLGLIRNGGPFPYPRKDGSVFGNFEKRLPLQPRGYYREFTVPTPGSRDRGPRRIVAGSGSVDDYTRSGEYYYSDDHYRTFRRIRP